VTAISTAPVPTSLGLEEARDFLGRHVDARQNVAVVHGFPSVLLWTEETVPVADILAAQTRERERGDTRPFHLYVGMPFCPRTEPAKCGYCLFPVEDYTGMEALTEYVAHLRREAALYEPLLEGAQVGSVFFGGGTSNLYRADVYPLLMDMVRGLFPAIGPDVDVTLEGLPALYTREKLRVSREAGFNRVSMGAQQMNDELNKLSGRRQSAHHVIQTIDWCHELGLGCNVDLIFGWPRQTVDTMVKDLEQLIATGVDDITHYELHVGGPTDFALNRRHELPTTRQNLEMYRVSRDLLLGSGFEQLTAYNWRRRGYRTSFVEGAGRSFEGMRGLGIGYAAASSFVWPDESRASWLYKNATSVSAYRQAIDEGRFPVERGYAAEPLDARLGMLFRHLQAMQVHRPSYQAAFGVDPREEFAGIWDALEERGFVSIDAETIRLVGDGVFYTPTVQGLLGHERSAQLRQRMFKEGRKLVTISSLLGGI
jgi:oxygen-independent coproporphyrinogen-3 oxidase